MKLNKTNLAISWIFQIIAAAILLSAAWMKFSGNETVIFVFDELEMGHFGKIVIAIIESSAAVLLLTNNLAHLGAILGFGNMLGAAIAHISVLGIAIRGDEGRLAIFLSVVLLSTLIVIFIRRKSLPLIGRAL